MCEKLTVHVRLIPYGNLRDAAKLHHYELRRRNMVRDAGKEPNPFVLERWMVNYARHALTGLAAQAPPFKAGVSRLYVSLVLYILLHDGEWGAAYGGDEVAVGPQGGDPAFE